MTSQDEQPKKNDEMIEVLIPASRLRRPFPLVWGMAALALFTAFAVVTQVQFNRINGEKFAEAKQEAYESNIEAYNTAVKAYDDCVATIEIRETYRDIFDGIEIMFQKTAELPANLLPESEVAAIYEESLTSDVQLLISDVVDQGLPPKTVDECPLFPSTKPEEP